MLGSYTRVFTVLERVGNLSLRFVTDTLYVFEMTGVPFINGRDTIGVPFLS